MRRALAWTLTGVLVVLCGRWIAYALAPSPLALTLQHQVGGPRLPLVTLVALALGLALSSAIVWLAALGVRERSFLERRTAPRIRLGRTLARAVVLSAATMLVFGLVESYIHWRAGLGWHGLHCLVGPVHSNALPILASLSLTAAAVFGAVEHVLGWMRRTIACLGARSPSSAGEASTLVLSAVADCASRFFLASLAPRPPPLALV